MTTQKTRAPRTLPTDTRRRVQQLLDEGDAHWFARNPGERYRTRMYFRGERTEGDGEQSLYVIVTQEGGRLVRRFHRAEEDVA